MSTRPSSAQPFQSEQSEYAVDIDARAAVDLLRADLVELLAAQRETTRRLDQLYASVRGAAYSAAEPDGLARSVRLVAARVQWLEEWVRTSGDAPVADLEAVDADLIELADRIHAGLDAEESLLDEDVRDRLRAVVDSFSRTERERDQAGQEVLAISAALESSQRTDPNHASQLARFGAAERRLAVAAEVLARSAQSARRSREQLVADDDEHDRLAPVIAAGRTARSELGISLRSRLVAELGRGALMPSWFSASLGPAPMAGTGSAWLDTATDVLVHRLVYGIDDAETALGPEPDQAGPRHRSSGRLRLAAALHALG